MDATGCSTGAGGDRRAVFIPVTSERWARTNVAHFDNQPLQLPKIKAVSTLVA